MSYASASRDGCFSALPGPTPATACGLQTLKHQAVRGRKTCSHALQHEHSRQRSRIKASTCTITYQGRPSAARSLHWDGWHRTNEAYRMDSNPSSGNKSLTRYADRQTRINKPPRVQDPSGGSEIVPQKLSSHLSKKYATLPPANWAMVATSGAVASCPAKLGPRPEGLRVRVKISSPGPRVFSA
ncbi:hypothetical protein V8C26DRAFT_131394 [Trichoderma gracile]